MKVRKLFFGLTFVLAAVLLILDATGIIAPLVGMLGDVSVFAVFLGILLLACIINRLYKRKPGHIFFPLAFLFMLFEKNIATLSGVPSSNLINNWLVLLIALLLTIGFSVLFSKKERWTDSEGPWTDSENRPSKREHRASCSLGAFTVYIDSASMTPHTVENHLGACVVYFEDPECFQGGNLFIENHFGSMEIHVPSCWRVVNAVKNHLGAVDTPMKAGGDGPLLTICGENHFGAVEVTYV